MAFTQQLMIPAQRLHTGPFASQGQHLLSIGAEHSRQELHRWPAPAACRWWRVGQDAESNESTEAAIFEEDVALKHFA